MATSSFYAVRFSPWPDLGEWLNIAVIGESLDEGRVEVTFPRSDERIRLAFGEDSIVRVNRIRSTLSRFATTRQSAILAGGDPQVPSVGEMFVDRALSVQLSPEIVVTGKDFEDALASVSATYLGSNPASRESHQQETRRKSFVGV